MKATVVFILCLCLALVQGEHMEPQRCVIDAGFVLDGSGSVTINNWAFMLSFIQTFSRHVAFMQTGTRIGVCSFGNFGTVNIFLDQFDDVLNFTAAVEQIPYQDENTNTASGLRVLRQQIFNETQGDRIDVPNVAVILTDGASTWEKNNTIPEADNIKMLGATIFAIGIGNKINMDELYAMSSDPDYVYVVDEFTKLGGIIDAIVNGTCKKQDPVTTQATQTTQEMTTTTEITTTTTTTTTTTPTPVRPMLDITFLLDSSGSIGYENWLVIKEFVKRILNAMTLGSSGCEVAVIEYSTESHLDVALGQYDNYDDLENAMDNMVWLNQRTNTSGAIRMAYRDIFTGTGNDRPDVDDVIVVVTDGDSNTDLHFLKTEADIARSRGIKLFALGVGSKTDMSELTDIASRPYYYFVHMLNDYQDLLMVWETVDQQLAQEGYPPEDMPIYPQDCPMDLVFLVDVENVDSDSISRLMDSFTDHLTMYAQDHIFVFYTAQTGHHENIIGNDMATSMMFIRMNIFTGSGEDRPTAQNIIAVITNGNVNDPDLLEDQVEYLKADGVKIVLLAFGDAASEEMIRDISSDPKYITTVAVESMAHLLLMTSASLHWYKDQICALASRSLWTCSFEEQEPQLCNMWDDSQAEFTWTVMNRRTPSRHTGPDVAYDGNFFAYIEASRPRQNGDRAIIYVPFTADGIFCLSFRYHMLGWHIGVLDVFIKRYDRETIIWRLSGPQGQDWMYGQTILLLQEGDMVGFRGVRAREFSGDIGIDSLEISRGPCPGYN